MTLSTPSSSAFFVHPLACRLCTCTTAIQLLGHNHCHRAISAHRSCPSFAHTPIEPLKNPDTDRCSSIGSPLIVLQRLEANMAILTRVSSSIGSRGCPACFKNFKPRLAPSLTAFAAGYSSALTVLTTDAPTSLPGPAPRGPLRRRADDDTRSFLPPTTPTRWTDPTLPVHESSMRLASAWRRPGVVSGSTIHESKNSSAVSRPTGFLDGTSNLSDAQQMHAMA
mmetsp:Transcript_15077/g.37129  ORF Transcript_15077/g.37129 Transcript_15077/m.37129 type:complete len:224 (+) Transcript_15077:413-1084(+)